MGGCEKKSSLCVSNNLNIFEKQATAWNTKETYDKDGQADRQEVMKFPGRNTAQTRIRIVYSAILRKEQSWYVEVLGVD